MLRPVTSVAVVRLPIRRLVAGGPLTVRPARTIFPRVYLARVVGRVVATVKQDTLSGVTLQWLQPITARGASTGKPLVAVDRVGVGPGEIVYYITSREAALTLDKPFAAVDAGIVGKVDFVDLGTERLLGERE